MNSVILIGRLARDPELNYAPQNTACTHFTLAVDRPRREGQDQGADFIRITVWNKQATTCDRYLSKGRRVAISGRIQTGSYKNRDGQTVYTTDVVADRVEFLGGSQESAPSQPKSAPKESFTPSTFADLPDTFEATDDGIPF